MKYNVEFKNIHPIIHENGSKYKIDLRKRLFTFAVDTIRFLATLPYKKEFDVFRYQLSQAGTSVGANYSPGQIV